MIPKSSGRKYLSKDNLVFLCRECHIWAHTVGKRSVPILQRLRYNYMNIKYPGKEEIHVEDK